MYLNLTQYEINVRTVYVKMLRKTLVKTKHVKERKKKETKRIGIF